MAQSAVNIVNYVPELDGHEVRHVVRAVNRHVEKDFAPVWGAARTLSLHASNFDPRDPDECRRVTRGRSPSISSTNGRSANVARQGLKAPLTDFREIQ